MSPELAGKFFTATPPSPNSKEPACNAGDLGSIPVLGRSPEEGKGYPLQYSCLENSMDRGDRWATVHGVAESQTRLSDIYFNTPLVAQMVKHLPTMWET